MPSGRTNNYPESGRGLGHVTPTIFGSTDGYPSDSLASCSIFDPSDLDPTSPFITASSNIGNSLGLSAVHCRPRPAL